MRPLGVGEIMDRAVTVFVQNAWLFIAIAAILYVPVSLTQLTMGDFWNWYFQTMASAAGGKEPATSLPPEMLTRLMGAETIQLVLLLLLSPLAYAGGLHAAKLLLDGEPASLRPVLRFALRHWVRVLLFGLLWGVVFGALLFGLTLLLSVVMLTLASLHAVIVSVLCAIVIAAGFGVLLLALSMAAGVGLVSTVAEDAGPLNAFRLGLERTMNRDYFWRSVLLGLILCAVALGFGMVLGMAGFALLMVLHSPLFLIAVNAVAGVLEFGFFATLLVTYYNDLRVRREGVDLSELANTLVQPVTGSP